MYKCYKTRQQFNYLQRLWFKRSVFYQTSVDTNWLQAGYLSTRMPISFPFNLHVNWINLLDKSEFCSIFRVILRLFAFGTTRSIVFLFNKMRTPITLRRTRLIRICIVAAIVVPILYLTLTWSDEKGKSIHSQLFASRTPREAPKLVTGECNRKIVFF